MPEGKIKSKDLTYENTLPPFLQKLHAQNAGRGDQDRHERPVARPKRVKAHDDDDYEPTVVDEAGETVSKAELEKMTSAAEEEDEGSLKPVRTVGEGSSEPKASGALQDDDAQRVDQKVPDGTATKKRKAAKVIGDEADAEKAANDDGDGGSSAKKVVKKAKKKAKPIKLAFNDDDDVT